MNLSGFPLRKMEMALKFSGLILPVGCLMHRMRNQPSRRSSLRRFQWRTIVSTSIHRSC